MTESQQGNSRWYPDNPSVGVGAIILKENRILMIKRAKEPGKGKWSIPGGRVELGESLFEAAKREVREECSIDVEIESIFDTSDRIIRDEDGRVQYHFVIIDVLAKHISGEPKAESDAEECRWATLKELSKLDMNPQLRIVLERAIRG